MVKTNAERQADYKNREKAKKESLAKLYKIFDTHAAKWVLDLTDDERVFLNKLDGELHG